LWQLALKSLIPDLLARHKDEFIAVLTDDADAHSALVDQLVRSPRRARGIGRSVHLSGSSLVEVVCVFEPSFFDRSIQPDGGLHLHRLLLEVGHLPFRLQAAVREIWRRQFTNDKLVNQPDYVCEAEDGAVEIRSNPNEEMVDEADRTEIDAQATGDIMLDAYISSVWRAVQEHGMSPDAFQSTDGFEIEQVTVAETIERDAWIYVGQDENERFLIHAFDVQRKAFALACCDHMDGKRPLPHEARRTAREDPAAVYARKPEVRLYISC
jgi:hypothetical protein